jgi:hypothetical protein
MAIIIVTKPYRGWSPFIKVECKARCRKGVDCFSNKALGILGIFISRICLVDVRSLAVYLANAPSQLF